MKDLTPELARTLRVSADEGAVIAEVQNHSPAARAGLRPGDVVVAINGRPVHSAEELRARLGVIPVGAEVDLKVLRGPEAVAVHARIGAIEAHAMPGGQALPELAGATLADATRTTDSGTERVVVVTGVRPESAADRNGLQPGDLIIGVNARRVRSVAALASALHGPRHIALNVIRGDFLLTISIR
jgi:serine protease Do/serine protease DegQ